jgi:hypothetical protein
MNASPFSRVYRALHRESSIVTLAKVSLMSCCVATTALIPPLCVAARPAFTRLPPCDTTVEVDILYLYCDRAQTCLGYAVAGVAAFLILRCIIDLASFGTHIIIDTIRGFQFHLSDLLWVVFTCGFEMAVGFHGPRDFGARFALMHGGIVFAVLIYLWSHPYAPNQTPEDKS